MWCASRRNSWAVTFIPRRPVPSPSEITCRRCRYRAAQSLEDGCSLGRAQAGARVPAGAGVVIGVAAGRDVVEGLRVLVQDRVDEPGVVAQLLVDPGDQSRPQGCHRARAAEGEGLAVHQDLVAGRGIGVARDVGNSAAYGAVWIDGRRDSGILLIRGEVEDPADPAAGMVFPDDLFGDLRARDPQRGPAAAQGAGTGGREIDRRMVRVIGVVTRPAVARGRAEGHAHGRGILEDLVNLFRRGIGGIFGRAPARRDHAGVVIAVVHGMVEHVHESLSRVGGEVDHDLGLGRDGPCHLNVQRDLAIGVLRVVRVGAGLVLGAVHRDRDDVGSFQAQALEIGIQIRGTEAAAVGGRRAR